MDSTLVIKNSHTYCKNVQVIKNQALCACSWGDRLVGKHHRSSPSATHKVDNQITPHATNFSHNGYHTCMLRDLQTSTQVFLKFTITSTSMTLILPPFYLKQLLSIKWIIVFNSLPMIVFIIPNLDAHHSRTNFITIANTMLF